MTSAYSVHWSARLPIPVFSPANKNLRTQLCQREELVGLPVVLPKVAASFRLVLQS